MKRLLCALMAVLLLLPAAVIRSIVSHHKQDPSSGTMFLIHTISLPFHSLYRSHCFFFIIGTDL